MKASDFSFERQKASRFIIAGTGWLRFGNDCYFFGTNGVDWFTANVSLVDI